MDKTIRICQVKMTKKSMTFLEKITRSFRQKLFTFCICKGILKKQLEKER